MEQGRRAFRAQSREEAAAIARRFMAPQKPSHGRIPAPPPEYVRGKR